MCQLIFSNLKNKRLNSLYITTQSIVNSRVQNKDGFGFFTPGKSIYKTGNSASLMLGLGGVYMSTFSDKPVMAHNRLCSLINKNKTGFTFSHPFESDHFILAHNGTLEVNVRSEFSEDFSKIDSQNFLDALEFYRKDKEGDPVKNFVELMNLTMKEFNGKFAFIIYDKLMDTFYIIKGKTADLYYCDVLTNNGENLGYVINTDRDSLFDGLILFSNLYSISNKGWIEVDTKKFIDIQKESIFIAGVDKILRVGDIKENDKIVVHRSVWREDTSTVNNAVALNANVDDITKHLLEFVDVFKINLEYLDEMFYKIYEKGLFQSSKSELEGFSNELTKLEKKSKGFGENHIREWERLLKLFYWPLGVHEECEKLKFPYMVNPTKVIRRIASTAEIERSKEMSILNGNIMY